MRIRVLGQIVPVPIAVLAVVEGLLAFLALYAAACLRFRSPISELGPLQGLIGPLWPQALIFALSVVLCVLAFGLYSGRQRATFTSPPA